MKNEILILAVTLLTLVGCKTHSPQNDGALSDPAGAEAAANYTPGTTQLGNAELPNDDMRSSNRDQTSRSVKSNQHRSPGIDHQQPNRGFDLDPNSR